MTHSPVFRQRQTIFSEMRTKRHESHYQGQSRFKIIQSEKNNSQARYNNKEWKIVILRSKLPSLKDENK